MRKASGLLWDFFSGGNILVDLGGGREEYLFDRKELRYGSVKLSPVIREALDKQFELPGGVEKSLLNIEAFNHFDPNDQRIVLETMKVDQAEAAARREERGRRVHPDAETLRARKEAEERQKAEEAHRLSQEIDTLFARKDQT